MNIATLLFGVIVIIFAWRGYQKGFIGSITRLLGWIVAYPAAIFFTKPVAKLLVQHTALDGLIVYFIAGTGIFLGVSFIMTLLLNGLSRLIPDNEFTSTGSKIGGVSVGVLVGGILGLLAVYGLSLVQKSEQTSAIVDTFSHEDVRETAESAAQQTTQLPPAPGIGQLTQARDSFIEASAKKLIGTAAATAVDLVTDDKTTTQVTKAFVEDPQTMLTHVQAMANNGEIKTLMSDDDIQSMLTTGDVHGLMRDDGFQALMNNPHMQALMSQSDVSSELGSRAAAEKMIAAWSRVNQIKHDPRVIAIITDPEFQQQLNSSNKLSLMMNPKMSQLTEIIFSNETPVSHGVSNLQVEDITHKLDTVNPASPTTTEESEDKPKTTVYRWTDDEGRVHYSDKPVKDQ
jgi:uncharacterized membrane protein required for colicin V production